MTTLREGKMRGGRGELKHLPPSKRPSSPPPPGRTSSYHGNYKVYCSISPLRERCVNSVVYELGKANLPHVRNEVIYTVTEHMILEGGGSFLECVNFFVDKTKAKHYYENKTSEPIMNTDLLTCNEKVFT